MAIHRSPAEAYIKSLILHPAGHTTKAIIRILDRQELDPIGPDYINEIREGLSPPPAFYPLDPRHAASRRYLREIGIYELFHPTPEVRMAWAILSCPSAKQRLESVLLTNVPPSSAASIVKDLGFPKVNADVIKCYKYFFYRTSLLDQTQLRALTLMRFDACLRSDSEEIRAQAKYLKKASYQDPRLTSCSMPDNEISRSLIKLQNNMDPANVNLLNVYRYIQSVAALKTAEALAKGGINGCLEAQTCMSIAEKAASQIQQGADPTEGIRKNVSALKLKQAQSSLPLIHELTEGQHTTDMNRPAEDRDPT